MFQLLLAVRDYECDMQGIVNNSNYLNYLEHTRHEFLHSLGLNFKALVQEEIFLVVAKLEVNYKVALGAKDEFVSQLAIARLQHSKVVFEQHILKDSTEYLYAVVTVVATKKGKIIRIPEHIYSALSLALS